MRYFTDSRGTGTVADHGLGGHVPGLRAGAPAQQFARLGAPQTAGRAPSPPAPPFRMFSPPRKPMGAVMTDFSIGPTTELVEMAAPVVVPNCPPGFRAKKIGDQWQCCIWDNKDGAYYCETPNAISESAAKATDLQRSQASCTSRGGSSSTKTNADGTKTLTCTGYDRNDRFASRSVWFDANGKFIDVFI